MTNKLLHQQGREIFWIEWWNTRHIFDRWEDGFRMKVMGADELGHDYSGTAEVIQGQIEHVYDIKRK